MVSPINRIRAHVSDELAALTEVAKTLTAPAELPELLDAVLKTIIRVLEQADIGAIMLWDQSEGAFLAAAAAGYNLEILQESRLHAGESITGKVFDEGRARLFNSAEEVALAMENLRPFNRRIVARALGSEALPQASVAAPIIAGEQKFGVLVLETLDSHKQFPPETLAFVQTLADLIALAIDRARSEARAKAAREARQADRMRAEVMAALSHELRMPLATIKGYATALLMDEVQWSDEKRREFLRQIEEACNDMEGMIQDILDTTLIEVNQLRLEYQPLRLVHIAREIASEVRRRSDRHRPVVDFPSTFPIIEADPRWIRQVFRNIVDNAIKYSPNGGLIVIRGEARPADVVISVSDQGVGIPPENLITLFEKYFRVRATSTLHVPGTGLGLPIARAIIEAHGGRIWVKSKVGEGTTVYFTLPRQRPGNGKEQDGQV
ncbi:MAG: GAF domain-containing protein [Anaerolineae bacterium]|nr:MAG: GAF domain-containing protein [Anaerolineae bacterium]